MGAGATITLDSACRLCGATTRSLGTRPGPLAPHPFEIRTCSGCRYTFVANPWHEYERIYDERYYRGAGADPLVDYLFELEHPTQTIRQYEWRGLLSMVSELVEIGPATRWLDFGCGNGGLVQYVKEQTGAQAAGYETGWIRDRAAAEGIPFLSKADLETSAGSFEIVTAIEVIEHVTEPLDLLRRMRQLLRPNGLLFITTGNAQPHREQILNWGYLNPTVHVSFFEPKTLSLALQKAGFRPQALEWRAGLADVIRFKVLKNLRRRRTALWERMLPWHAMARFIDRRLCLSEMPIGWAA